MRRLLFLLGPLVLPVGGGADEVFTRGGGRLTGEVVERGPEWIVVDIGIGRIGLPYGYVERIVPGATPLSLYRERARSLSPQDVTGWLALAQWARQQELPTQAEDAFAHVLSADPDNAAAHRALGHVPLAGRWMTLEESYRVRGFVSFEGGWVTPDEREAVLTERAVAAEQARAEAEARARIRETEARIREAEARARAAEAEARALEEQVRGLGSSPGLVVYPWPVAPPVLFSNAGFHWQDPGRVHPGCRRLQRFASDSPYPFRNPSAIPRRGGRWRTHTPARAPR